MNNAGKLCQNKYVTRATALYNFRQVATQNSTQHAHSRKEGACGENGDE